MKKTPLAITLSMIIGGSLMATPMDITVADGQFGNGAAGPWVGTSGLGAAHEDNETEPRTITGDQWDVEAFVYDPSITTLSLIGTYDFKNGQDYHNVNYSSGAIFVRGDGSPSWTYAYVLDFNDNSYKLYDNFTTINPSDVPASTPWTINTATANMLGTGSFTYSADVTDPFGLGLQRADGGTGHNEIDLGLGLLPGTLLDNFDTHWTISCGNDEIQGHYQSVPDGGATALLLGFGMFGLVFARRAFLDRKSAPCA